MTRVVVVGGSGNISVGIVRLLLKQGYDVTCFNRGQRRGGVPEGARLIIGDRYQRAEFEALMQREKFDVAIDMMCFTKEDAESDLRAFKDVRHFIHCSTVCTYGIQYDWMPVTENHELRPISAYARGKAAADAVFMAAHYSDNFPVTIIKPSTTFGPRHHLPRQIALDTSWIDRIRKFKPILICGDGSTLHQFMHADDAAAGFVGVIGKDRCIGQVYNLVNSGYTTWADYHCMAMYIIGAEVDMVSISLADIIALKIPNSAICEEIFAHNSYFSNEKILRDVPEFCPQHTLEDTMRDALAGMDAVDSIVDSDTLFWEDQVIRALRQVRDLRLRV